MPSTDILNPTTVLTNNAVVSSANALAVKVISGGGSGITVNTTTITGGTTTRLLYDNAGTVGEAGDVTYTSATSVVGLVTLAMSGNLGVGGAGTTSPFQVATSSARALRMLDNASSVEVDATNVAQNAFQPLLMGGSTTGLHISGTTALAISSALVATFTSAVVMNTTLAYGGVTFASTVTGSGSLVGATNPTLSSLVITGTMTYGGVTYASTVTGTGSNVLSTNPTLSSLIATGTLTYGGVALASTVTGTGSMVLSASPTLSGTASFAATVHSGLATFSSAQTTVGTGTFQNAVAASASVVSTGILFSSTASFGVIWGALGSVAPTLAVTQGTLLINTSGSSIASRMFIRTSSSWTSITTAG